MPIKKFKETKVSIIERLKKDIEKAVANFVKQNGNLSQERQVNLRQIWEILQSENPTTIRDELVNTVENLSTGITKLWPFLEVNKFKNVLRDVINLPIYSETAILKALVAEGGGHSLLDRSTQLTTDAKLVARLDRLEKVMIFQGHEISALQNEISRLKTENLYLTKTISMLSEKNKQLTFDCQKLQDAKSKAEQDASKLKLDYEQLQKENRALKKQLQTLTNPPSSEEVKQTVATQASKSNPLLPVRKQFSSCKLERASDYFQLENLDESGKQGSRRSLSLMT